MAKDPGQKGLGKTEPNNPVSNLTCHDIPTLAQPGPINVCHAHINDPSTYTAHSQCTAKGANDKERRGQGHEIISL